MPITDNDLVTVRKATRSGATNIQVEVQWIDGVTGEDKGDITVEVLSPTQRKVTITNIRKKVVPA